MLIGEPGVGKTAIVEGLALRIVNGDVPESLADKKLLVLENTVADKAYARTLSTHYADALHYATARGCVFVTRNVKDFPFPDVVTPDDIR